MDLNTYLQTTFTDLAKKMPGFISATLITNEGVVMSSYPSQMRNELELTAPFFLQLFKQAVGTVNYRDNGKELIKEILISTNERIYMLESRSQKNVGVLTLDINKANLGLARLFSDKVAEAVFEYFKREGFV